MEMNDVEMTREVGPLTNDEQHCKNAKGGRMTREVNPLTNDEQHLISAIRKLKEAQKEGFQYGEIGLTLRETWLLQELFVPEIPSMRQQLYGSVQKAIEDHINEL